MTGDNDSKVCVNVALFPMLVCSLHSIAMHADPLTPHCPTLNPIRLSSIYDHHLMPNSGPCTCCNASEKSSRRKRINFIYRALHAYAESLVIRSWKKTRGFGEGTTMRDRLRNSFNKLTKGISGWAPAEAQWQSKHTEIYILTKVLSALTD